MKPAYNRDPYKVTSPSAAEREIKPNRDNPGKEIAITSRAPLLGKSGRVRKAGPVSQEAGSVHF